jgi:ABC-type uncharacterized transport system auxiliary subunit
MSRTAICLLLLCACASSGVAARDYRMQGPGSGGGNNQQCADEEILAAIDDATQKSAKPRVVVTTQPRKPAKVTPAVRGDGDPASRLPTPRWHSFLPGMFR